MTFFTALRALRCTKSEARDYLLGAGSVVDPLPVTHHYNFWRSDSDALASDWQAIGTDLLVAVCERDDPAPSDRAASDERPAATKHARVQAANAAE